MITDFLRAQHQTILVTDDIAKYFLAFLRRKGDRGTGSEIKLASVEQGKGRVLQHLGIHRQVLERAVDEARHHCVGNGADAGLHRQQTLGQSPQSDFFPEKIDQMRSDGGSFRIGRQDGRGTVELFGNDDCDNFFWWNLNCHGAYPVARRHNRDRFALRAVLGNEYVVQPFEFQRLGEVDFDDHLVSQNREGGAVAYRGGGNDGASLGDGDGLDDGDVDRCNLPGTQHFDSLGQVLIDIHYLAAIDCRTQYRI